MNAVSIGKGFLRLIVRSKTKRERLARIPDVRIEGARVIFPEWLAGNIRRLVDPPPKRRGKKPVQADLFEEEKEGGNSGAGENSEKEDEST